MRKTLVDNIDTADVVIVGGGMVGLSLALMLAQQAICERIIILDERPFDAPSLTHYQPSFDDRSTAISAGSARLLKQVGVWSKIISRAQPIRSVNVSDKGLPGFNQYTQDQNNDQPLGYVVDNRWLGLSLKDAAQQYDCIEVFAPAEVRAITPCAGGTQVHALISTDGAETERRFFSELVVLADGAASPLAKTLGISFSKHKYQQHALITNVAHAKPHNGVAFEHFTEQGPLAFLPLPDSVDGKHCSAVVWTHHDDEIEYVMQASDEAFRCLLQQQFGWRLGCIDEVGRKNVYSLNLFFANEQVRSGIVLVGNAAHFLHPVAGQGFNLALRDCAELVVQLKRARHQGTPLGKLSLLQGYMKRRETDQWLTTELSHSFISLFTSSNIGTRTLRSSGLSLMNKTAPIKSLFFNQMMGQGMNGVNL